MALTTLFTVHVPAPTHPDSLAIELDDPARPPIPLACQIDRKPNSRGIIVACHGMLDNRDKPLVAYLREASPWDIVTFDFRGMGESGGQTEFANHGKEADDIHAVVAHVERTYGRVVCVMGHSKGGVATNIWASRYPDQSSRVGRFVNINTLFFNGAIPLDPSNPDGPRKPIDASRVPPYVWAKFRRGPRGKRDELVEFVVTEHGLWYRNNVLNLDKITAKIPKEVAVLTLMGEKDDLTQPERDAPLWNRAYGARDHTLLVLPGCSHYYLEKFEQDLAGKAIFGWLEKQVPVSVGTHEAAKL